MRNSIFILVALFIAACGDKTSTNNHHAPDVQWYVDHPAEHKAQLEKCSNNPGKLESTAECINAREAAVKNATGFGKFQRSKPKD